MARALVVANLGMQLFAIVADRYHLDQRFSHKENSRRGDVGSYNSREEQYPGGLGDRDGFFDSNCW
jgi:hypothetical protein